MTMRNRRTTPITDRIVRIYEVTLWPDESPDGPYDPFTITLGYPVDKVPDDPYSDAVKAEALKVAIKAEVKAERLDADHGTTFVLSNLRLKQAKFYRAADTIEAKRATDAQLLREEQQRSAREAGMAYS